MDTLRMTNYIIAVVFFVCYTYQFLYIPVPWLLAKRKAAKAAALEATPHNYAVLICARNESAVIADLIGSLRSQGNGGVGQGERPADGPAGGPHPLDRG